MPKTEEIDYSAFKVDAEGKFMAQVHEATASGKVINCGWIPWDKRTKAQEKLHAEVMASLPVFTLRGRFANAERRYKLWEAGKLIRGGKFLRYNWQQTGSCVGAGGDNALKTALAVDIAIKGKPNEFRDTWWPFAYGRSRFYSGIRGRGEGSSGTGWAKAVLTDGFFEIDPAGEPDLPDFKEQDGWLVEPSAVEMEWSDGGKIAANWIKLGRTRTAATMARVRNKDEAFEAIANGYPLTQASSFGFRAPKVMGSKFPIRVAEWNGTWNHQTYLDEVWDHPELSGIYFRWGNNWGPGAHGAPTGDEPPGGVYVHERLVDQLCKEGEVFALNLDGNGFPARDLPNYEAFRFPKRSTFLLMNDKQPAA